MSNKPSKLVEVSQAIGFVAAISVVFFLLWLLLLGVLTLIFFAGLSLLTPWSFAARLGTSVLASFLFLKLVWFVLEGINLLPESWLKRREPEAKCPNCSKTLRTPRARQCQHCYHHWHEIPEAEIEKMRAETKSRQDWSIRRE